MLSEPFSERYKICSSIIQNEIDPSMRVEAIWVLGESFNEISESDKKKVSELMDTILRNDDNDIVKHEACFLIGENNLREKIPLLRKMALESPSELVRHEAIEALGLLQDFESKTALKKALADPNTSVKQTAEVVLKQLERAENSIIPHKA
jgi:HEAT repeat protein